MTNQAGGTLGVTVDGTAGTSSVISGPGVSLAGTLSVATVGTPADSSTYTPIAGPVTGTFSAFSFGPFGYAVSYPSNAVVLTAKPVFSVSATPLTPAENVELTTPQVATLGSATDGTGAYSATVNYGDGSGTTPATVNVTGSTGTVDGPSHTFTSPGTYTVTTAVANTDGTTISISESLTVTGPTITGLSKTKITQGKKLKTIVSGSGLDSHDTVTVSNTGVTVISVKVGKVSKKHPHPTLTVKLAAGKTAALGPCNVTVTDMSNGANVIAVDALTVVS